ncbi:DUF2163 domain-containing protein [Rickettsia endosymbiont of Halotydeus destructor]|uniref:DUF2163 domain-containing protein n=1 Tax=Rickettsia endosymbiont of Halotydeus destructor TaxID=2996754 RepID=UPI003BAEFAF8
MVSYQKSNEGKLIQKREVLGEVTLNKNLFHTEVRGLTQFLSQTMCESYTPHCRANLGDHRCKFNLNQNGFTVSSKVTQVTSQQSFIATSLLQPNDWFTYGYIKWQSGKNVGPSMEVKSFNNNLVTLVLPMPFIIQENDEFTIVAGCDKASKTCIEKFNNITNFRGEPDLPGIDRLSSRN